MFSSETGIQNGTRKKPRLTECTASSTTDSAFLAVITVLRAPTGRYRGGMLHVALNRVTALRLQGSAGEGSERGDGERESEP